MENQILIVDIGNTTTVYGVFEGETLVSSLTVSTKPECEKCVQSEIESFVKSNSFNCKEGMIFSVVPKQVNKVKKLGKKYFGVNLNVFDWESYEYKDKSPEITDKIGADLLADLVAVTKYYGGPALICDLGTVNKILLVDEKNIFVGCSFTPGMQGSLEFFFKNTALLPKFNKVTRMEPEPAHSTLDSMKHGVYWSTVGYVNSVYHKLGDKSIKLILTGGNSSVIKDDVKNSIYDKDLTLKGMNELYKEITNETK